MGGRQAAAAAARTANFLCVYGEISVCLQGKVIVFCRNFPYNHEERQRQNGLKDREKVEMNKNEWYQVGEDIRKQVQSAIDSNDFSELSKTISNTVSQAVNDVGKSINDAFGDAVGGAKDSFRQTIQKTPNQTYQNQPYQGQPSQNGYSAAGMQNGTPAEAHQKWMRYGNSITYGKPNLRPSTKLFIRHPKGAVSGIFMIVGGFGFAGFMGIEVVNTMMSTLFAGGTAASVIGLAGDLIRNTLLTVLGLGVGIRGANLRGRATRFQHYVAMVKDKLYCSIEDMAAKTGRSKRFIRKDLKKMMQKGMFLQAHLDKEENCFIASDEVYEQYRLTQKQYEETMQTEVSRPEQTETAEEKKEHSEEVLRVLEEGRDYIRMIRLCNDEIPGEEMSEKLDKLEMLVTRIFAQVEKEPELAAELQKMLSYYLPTTQKLLEAYRDLDKQNVEVKNISDTKKEIEATVDTINTAFEKFLDELFREKAWDIQSDITVLNTMLKQDGYLKNDFERQE